MNFNDTFKENVTIKPHITKDGYLTATPIVARTGVQDYLRSELGLEGEGIVSVNRDAAQVFAEDSMSSFVNKPITLGHVNVNASNWGDDSVGNIGSRVINVDGVLRADICVMDAKAVKTIMDEDAKELSVGYTADIVKASDDVTWDYEQVNIKVNHLAIVKEGRAGVAVIGDESKLTENNTMDNEAIQLLISDGIAKGVAEALKSIKLADALAVELADFKAEYDALTPVGDSVLDCKRSLLKDSISESASDDVVLAVFDALNGVNPLVLVEVADEAPKEEVEETVEAPAEEEVDVADKAPEADTTVEDAVETAVADALAELPHSIEAKDNSIKDPRQAYLDGLNAGNSFN